MEETGVERVLEIRTVGFVEILDAPNADTLLAEYAAECSIPEIGTISPQRETYARMESSGLMHSFGAFEGNDLVGFATVLVCVLPHYGKRIATVESLFLASSHRSGGYGRRLMSEIEAWAKQAQCVAMLYNARAGSRLERLLASIPKYQRTNSVFLWSVS
ncbi:MAG TPA: GNAT family N-acetyltransferase [Candidatus Nitrosotalea sp.]|nr:GNAT family N-acetyltransferase [Candidatus Nitrosotalea sp.]